MKIKIKEAAQINEEINRTEGHVGMEGKIDIMHTKDSE